MKGHGVPAGRARRRAGACVPAASQRRRRGAAPHHEEMGLGLVGERGSWVVGREKVVSHLIDEGITTAEPSPPQGG